MSPRRPDPVWARYGSAKAHPYQPGLPELGRCGAVLFGDSIPARKVPEDDRCMHPACRLRWPAVLAAVQ